MERDRALLRAWADVMFDTMDSWWPQITVAPEYGDPEVARLLALLRNHDPDFLCQHLDRITRDGGVLDHHDNEAAGRKFIPGGLPPFLRPVIKAALSQCGERAIDFLRKLMAAPAAKRREDVASFIFRLPDNITTSLAEQAFANLLDDRGMDHQSYVGTWVDNALGQRQRYVDAHLQFLLRAGQSCDDVVRKFDVAVAELRERGGAPSPQLLERLAYLNAKGPGRSPKCKLQ